MKSSSWLRCIREKEERMQGQVKQKQSQDRREKGGGEKKRRKGDLKGSFNAHPEGDSIMEVDGLIFYMPHFFSYDGTIVSILS